MQAFAVPASTCTKTAWARPVAKRVAAGHVHGDDLMRTEDHLGISAAFLVPARHLLNQ